MRQFFSLTLILLLWLPFSSGYAAGNSYALGDFFVKTYPNDSTGGVGGFRLYTKQPHKKIFLAIGCNEMNPYPEFKLILQNDDILTDSNKFMNASVYFLPSQITQSHLNGILTAKSNFEGDQNTIRLEINGDKTLRKMEQDYQKLLQQLSQNQKVIITVQHRSLGKFNYTFTLTGLKNILAKYPSLCH